MRGSAGPWLIDTWMDALLDTEPFAALHTAVPSPDDPTATEATGGWYARKPLTWDELDGTSAANAAPLKWTLMPAITIVGVALYTTSTGSSLIVWCPYDTPQSVPVGGSLSVAAHDLFVEVV